MIYELSITSCWLASMSFVFFLIGCFGYASDENVMKYLPWITAHEHGKEKYINLSGIYSDGEGRVLFATVDCTEDFCNRCAGVGNTAVNLHVVAAILTPLITFASAYLSKYQADKLQCINVLMTCTVFVSSVTGFAMFMSSCTFQNDDSTPLRTQYGSGAIIALIGIILMGIVLLCQTIVFIDDLFAVRPRHFADNPFVIVTVSPGGGMTISPNLEYIFSLIPLPEPISTRVYPKLPEKLEKMAMGC